MSEVLAPLIAGVVGPDHGDIDSADRDPQVGEGDLIQAHLKLSVHKGGQVCAVGVADLVLGPDADFVQPIFKQRGIENGQHAGDRFVSLGQSDPVR